MYKIKLSKCAYIFDNSSGTYKTSRRQAEEDGKKQKILKAFYDNKEKREEWIPATKKTIKFWTGEEVEQIVAIIDGIQFNLNALQINKTSEPQEIYNNKKIVDLSHFSSPKFTTPRYQRIYSKKYKTLEIENFTGPDDLGYMRVHFKGRYYVFIVDNKNNLYTAEGIAHRQIQRADIFKAIEITHSPAARELVEVLDFIQECNQIEV